MRILLIYPRYGYHNRGGFQEPLGLLYVAGALKSAGNNVELLDLSFDDSLPKLANRLNGINAVGISCTTALYGKALEILRAIKAIDSALPVVLGGPHATAMPEKCLEDGFDFAMVGEAEKNAPLLFDAINQGVSLASIPAIAYRDGKNIRVNPQCDFVEDLDSLPHPDRSMIDYKKYFEAGLGQVGVVAMRGCPFNCTYCKPMQEKLFGRKIRKRSAGDVASEIDSICRKIHNRILFRDDAFGTYPPEWFDELGMRFAELKTPLWGWVCQARVDQITPGRLDAMQKAGCKMIAFGVESGSRKILDYYRKGISTEQTERAFELCRQRGIGTHAFIMIGAPIETMEDVEATIRLLERIKPNSVSASIATPAPGTHLYDATIAEGVYNIASWSDTDYMANTRPIKLQFLTLDQVLEAREKIASMGIGFGG